MTPKPAPSAVVMRSGKAENPYIPLSSFSICEPDYHGYFASKNKTLFKSSLTREGGWRQGEDLQIRPHHRAGLSTAPPRPRRWRRWRGPDPFTLE